MLFSAETCFLQNVRPDSHSTQNEVMTLYLPTSDSTSNKHHSVSNTVVFISKDRCGSFCGKPMYSIATKSFLTRWSYIRTGIGINSHVTEE